MKTCRIGGAILCSVGVSAALSGGALAQPLPNGVPTVLLERVGGSGTTPMEVAYNPNFARYYASNGGNPTFSVWTYDSAGNIVSGPTAAGADVRSINYNPNTGNVEVVQFADSELRIATLDGSGNWVDASTSAGVTIQKPDSQSMPAYDAARNRFYAYPASGSSQVSVISRTTGSITGTINLDLGAAGVSAFDLASFAVGYLPGPDWLVVFDAANDDAVVFDVNGNFLGTSSLATDIRASFASGSANNQVFVYDDARGGWQGYDITPAGGGGLFFSEDGNLDGLYRINRDTGAATHIGTTTVSGSTVGLAPSGDPRILYGSKPFGLLRINADGSGASTTGSAGIEGMAYDRGADVLYGAINGNFFEIDKATGATSPLPSPPGNDDVEGLAFGNRVVYGLADGGELYRYTPATGNWGMIGLTGVNFDQAGLAFDPGRGVLYAKGNQDTFLYEINPANAAIRRIGDTGIQNGGGLAFVGAGGDDCFDTVGCPADVDGDGDADVNDFFGYLDLFSSGDVCADLDDDGDVDVNDFFSYLDLFEQGC